MKKNAWRQARFAASVAAAWLFGAVFMGGAHGAFVDCRMCHLDPAPGSPARDYFEYFVLPQLQHPSGIVYPPEDNEAYLRPDAFEGDISFFDDNGNGIADPTEVQLFGVIATVECASCHREHGTAPPPEQPNMYLRMDTRALCMVCHRK